MRNLLLAIAIFSLTSLAGQIDSTRQGDLKIGLVLSGGGSKAMAQIGALKVIDSAGIKLDYIGGTSMGAIIGAMYSLGYTPRQIETYLRDVDWDALLANDVPRNSLGYFDRKFDSRYVLTFPVKEGRIQLPRGINYAQYILKELSFITQQAYHYENFNDFPIPFFCVATNLENGKARVFEKDVRLIDALRATSAFPSLFTPYEVQDTLYVDGGVVNNFPVKVLKDKGMDVIIGVDVQKFLNGREELNSMVKVLEQTSSFINAKEIENQKKYTDILIRPEMDKANITSFHLYDTLVKTGFHAAMQHWETLKALANMDDSRATEQAFAGQALPLGQFYVNNIAVFGNETSTDDFIISKLRIRKGDSCSIEDLENSLDQLYGTKYFETVDYTITPQGEGFQLNINVREKQVFTTFRAGLNYSDDFKTAVLLNLTHRNFLFQNSRFSADLALGDNPRVEVSYFVDRGFIPTLGVNFRAYQFRYRNYENFKAVGQAVYQDFSLDFFLQSTLKDAYAIGAGVQLEEARVNQEFERAGYNNINRGFINYYGFIDFDSFDHEYFPREGFQLRGQYRIIAERIGFETFRPPSSVVDLNYRQAISLNKRFTAITKLYGASTIGSNLSFPYQLHLGSLGHSYINYIQPFIGYRFMELSGRNALYLRGDLFYEFIKDHYLIGRYNIGKIEPTLDDIFASRILLDGYSLGYSYNSPVGPLEFNLTASSNHSNIYSYISLGFWF